jgi:chromosomal replication initiator protein
MARLRPGRATRDDRSRRRERPPFETRELLRRASIPVNAPNTAVPVQNAASPVAQELQSAAQSQRPLDLNELWQALLNAVRVRVQPEQYETWFRRAALAHADGEVVRIVLQNGFSRDWLNSYYRDVIEQAVKETLKGARRVEFSVDPEFVSGKARSQSQAPGSPEKPGGGAAEGAAPESGAPTAANAAFAQRPAPVQVRVGPGRGVLGTSDLGLNPKYTFDNFVVGPCNRFAHAAAVGASESPGKAYNPFFLHGNVGLGKTHLLQSFCYSLLERNPRTRILFLSCETFVNHFINALENGDLQKFRTKYRNVDVLVVDDIHLLANKDRTQEEFFHTFNTLYQQGKQIVLSSDSPPKDIPTLQERLVSRFRWGLVTEIEPPCYETRMAILKRKSRERGREIPDDVARLLAERIDSNIRELEGAVTKLLSYAGLSCQPVSVELAREALKELFAARKGQPSMEDILDVITEHFNVKLSELQSKKRTNAVAYPRQVAMYLARQITRHSLEEIGGFFGGRDHSTVIYAVDKVTDLVDADPACRELVESFLHRLQSPAV